MYAKGLKKNFGKSTFSFDDKPYQFTLAVTNYITSRKSTALAESFK